LRWSPRNRKGGLRIWLKELLKDNVRDELDEAAGRGRRVREDRKEAAPEEVVQPGSGGVKDNVRDELAETQERR